MYTESNQVSISFNGIPVHKIDAQTEKNNRITSSRKYLLDHVHYCPEHLKK